MSEDCVGLILTITKILSRFYLLSGVLHTMNSAVSVLQPLQWTSTHQVPKIMKLYL